VPCHRFEDASGLANDADVILCDVHLGQASGVDLMLRLRDQGVAAPVIMISGDRTRDTVVGCIEAGTVDYIVKPFTRAKLLEKLTKHVDRTASLAVQCDDLLRVLQSPADSTRDGPASDARASLAALPRDTALARLDGDESLLSEIARLFLDQAPRRIAEARNAVAERDAPRLRKAVCSLKRGLSYFDTGAALASAKALEHLAEAGDLADAPPALRDLECEVDRLLQSVSDLVSAAAS
jgi:DNA-binding response OmpR family regulator